MVEYVQHKSPIYDIRLDKISSGFVPGQDYCWTHPRAGIVKGEKPSVVVTMSPLKLTGSDVFFALNETRSDEMGKTWSYPAEQPALGRHALSDGLEEVISDFTPAWHEASGKLLGIGHTVTYKGNHIYRPIRKTVYAVYDAGSRSWTEWREMAMPSTFFTSGAGSTQRFDLENGDILLPIYFSKSVEDLSNGRHFNYSTVVRCRFDGESLRYIEHGSELTVHRHRGYVEPSLTRFRGQFFLTLRADDHGAVARSADGLHFGEPKAWTWDDGSEVLTYNTQQHWVTHSDGLFLVYTRKADNNDHIFRHRAPLFIAEVDPERLCLIRASERVLVPERGARLCNFGVVDVNERETWVTVAEWMQNGGVWGEEMRRLLLETYTGEELAPLESAPHMSGLITLMGADNSVFAARILWKTPNRSV
ncbi:exo-alpha-sialidase [Paenibacillus hemerocallicola]|uniref:Exo-alpha-sialidase n=1 Tax=Paenibacillus hemerocallicola TaxID=1172614 RepID=A0A5C4TFI1_9BACL|nr:sialidase family protein [Paenibacillus hemerocallicola]TNJ67791.1 exo-alpha-sialidase [Paenibacillus hemerocallicola]